MLVSGRLGLLASALLCARVVAQRQCYYPSGLAPDVGGLFVPCNTNTSVDSMCCNEPNGDRCTPEGICLSGSNGYWRDMCTDQTWLAPECVTLCPTIDNPALTRCADDTWCCGQDNSTCCNSGEGVKLSATRAGTVALPATFTASSSSTSVPAKTTTGSSTTGTGSASSTSTAPASKAASGKSNNNIAIAVGVGVSIGVVLVALAVGLFFWRRSVNKKKKPVEIGDTNVETRDQKDPMISSSDNSPTVRYDGSGIEDGSVMSRLATGSTADQSRIKQNTVHSFGGEIHEMDQSERERFHELSGEDRRLGSPQSVEKF